MSRTQSPAADATVAVWDPLVRIGHWLLVVAFAIAWLTEGRPEWLHVWPGYLIGAVVVLRVIWGLVGTRHARFSDFVTGPAKVFAYLRDLLSFRSRRYLGHSPAGGAMTLALLLMLALTVFSGMAALATDRGRGPLAGVFAQVPAAQVQTTGDGEHEGGSLWSDIHGVSANLTGLLILIHVGGVALASLAHRENLARSMVTGRKRP